MGGIDEVNDVIKEAKESNLDTKEMWFLPEGPRLYDSVKARTSSWRQRRRPPRRRRQPAWPS